MSGERTGIPERVAAVQARVDIVGLVGAAVKLVGRSKPRGKCPFHGSKSDSFAVYPDSKRAQCWGCGWQGDAIAFLRDFYGLDFIGALERLEGELGLDGLEARPVRRDKVERRRQAPETVDSALVAEHLWAAAEPDAESLRVWLRARHVPEAMLGDHWFGQLRFCASAPIAAWPVGGGAGDVAQAPAMVGLIRRPRIGEDGQRAFAACGVHATYLSPGLRAKMNRKRSNGDPVPARKMYGTSAGGCVILGSYRRDAPLFVGEGIETVLSGMALCDAGEDACGLAVLSLDNLQGRARTRRIGRVGGVLPLYDVRPDPERPGLCFAHEGPVTGLIDADMAPLKGPIDRETGQHRGLPVQERPGGPVVLRTITTIERAEICAALFTLRWREAGCRRVSAIRPHAGRDFNDEAREVAA